jgi:hypothetical protein
MGKINLREFDFDLGSAAIGALGGIGAMGVPLAAAAFIGGRRRKAAEQKETDEANAAREAAEEASRNEQQQIYNDALTRLSETGLRDAYEYGINPQTGQPWRTERNYGTTEHINNTISAIEKHKKGEEQKRILGSSQGAITVPGSQAVNLTTTQQKQIAAERKTRLQEIMDRLDHATKVHSENKDNLARINEIRNQVNRALGFREGSGFFPSELSPLTGTNSFHEMANNVVGHMDRNPELFPVPPTTKKKKQTNESVHTPIWFNRI